MPQRGIEGPWYVIPMGSDPDAHLRSIAQQFGITFREAHVPPHAILPTVFLLDDRYVLRWRGVTELEQFRRELMLLRAALEQVPFPLPMPLSTKNGQECVREEERFWVLSPQIPGRPLGTWQEIQRGGDQDMQLVLRSLRNLHDRTMGLHIHAYEDPLRFSQDMRKKLEVVSHFLAPHALNRIDQALAHVAAHEAILTPQDLCFIHGDFHHGNIIVNDRREITGLIDLDFSRIGYPLEDLGFTVMMCLRSCDRNVFVLDLPYERQLLEWYGLHPDQHSLFAEYLLLGGLIDLWAFTVSTGMQQRDAYLQYQISLVQDCCARFTTEGYATALVTHDPPVHHFPVALSKRVLALALSAGVDPRDIEEHFTRGGGHGGQKVNKTSNCVELTHRPSGICIRVHRHREQHRNREEAFRDLIEKIAMQAQEESRQSAAEKRRKRIPSEPRPPRVQKRVLKEKRHRGVIKRTRKIPPEEEGKDIA